MILTVSKDKLISTAVSDMLYYIGCLSYPATPEEAIFDLNHPYRAVLLLNRDNAFDEEEISEIISSYLPHIPIFSYGGAGGRFITYIDSKFSLSEAVGIMQRATESLHEFALGEYKLFAFNASIDLNEATFVSKILPFTKTETMILRSFIRFYPLPISSAEILKFAFRHTRYPDINSIRTHLSLMNKKFKKDFGISIFEFTDKGYILNSDLYNIKS